ncbi:MAG: hypothetical protein O2897_04155 [bacterium]|nr:hypothetical protein [bacterium]
MQNRFWKASRLLEIFITVVILLTLAILTIPYFKKFQCVSKQSEARMELYHLYSVQKLMQSETGSYKTMQELRKSKIVTFLPKYYQFTISNLDKENFIIEATSLKEAFVTDDIWSIDQKGKIEHLKNACTVL